MGTWNNRLNKAMALRGVNNAGLAEKTGVSAPTVSDWTSGVIKNLKADNALKIAAALKVCPDWLVNGKGPMDESDPPNTEPGPPIYRDVPLISWVHAGEPREAVDPLHPEDAEERIPSPVRVNPSSYALRVRGDSMAPDYPNGMVIIVEPDVDWTSGQHIIAKNGEGEAVFRKISREAGEWMMVPLNSHYPPRPLGEYHVIGVVRAGVILAP